LATAAVLHFSVGSEPRNLTGIALKCRKLETEKVFVPQGAGVTNQVATDLIHS
jgi:hypothetical protein